MYYDLVVHHLRYPRVTIVHASSNLDNITSPPLTCGEEGR